MEDPRLEQIIRTGFPDNRLDLPPRCPICGRECEDIYIDSEGEVAGCNNCIRKYEAWEREECYPDNER